MSNIIIIYSVLVGEGSSIFGRKIQESDEEDDDDAKNQEGASVFSSSWLPGKGSKYDSFNSTLLTDEHDCIDVHLYV